MSYRPSKSLTLWAFGNLFHEHPLFGIRVAHFCGLAMFAGVVLLWTRTLKLGVAGTWAAAIGSCFHPVLPQSWGSIDGVDALVSSAMVWLGAWCVWRFREHIIPATLGALLCFAVGIGFKEFAFALVPMAALTVLMFWRSRRILGGVVVVGTLMLAVVALLMLRERVIPPGLRLG